MRLKITALTLLCLIFSASCTTQKPPVKLPPYQYSLDANDLPVVNVSFIVTSKRPEIKALDNKTQIYKELAILNRYFVDENNQKIFKFKIHRYYSYQDFNKRKCDLANQLNQPTTLIPDNLPSSVKSCFPRRKSKEVLFIIYDSYGEKLKYADITSWGFRNQGQPFILIDWERLNYQTQAASVHEMGHAFGLGHVCSPKATKTTPTNIMSSYDCRLGSGGLRNLGFTREQLNIMLNNYNQYP
ncbi:metalloprotease [Acinetobacter sp. ANC 3882]|uniref:metalloprotease n=1 Tax=Acinetobacter sp. ANC 3882 TaxID=2923423 RepID=UPI001F4A78E1|nr:metalloprotease [Acinetobacter sp. ANC 3882]MCH7315485.1 metalloprotease [Acinetobacter sp. ANC 3882]